MVSQFDIWMECRILQYHTNHSLTHSFNQWMKDSWFKMQMNVEYRKESIHHSHSIILIRIVRLFNPLIHWMNDWMVCIWLVFDLHSSSLLSLSLYHHPHDSSVYFSILNTIRSLWYCWSWIEWLDRIDQSESESESESDWWWVFNHQSSSLLLLVLVFVFVFVFVRLSMI